MSLFKYSRFYRKYNNNTVLVFLRCFDNQLTTLYLSHNVALQNLWCNSNQLTTLDVTNNTNLLYLECQDNLLTYEALNTLFGTLNAKPVVKNIYIESNLGTSTCDTSIATEKAWIVHI